MCEFMLHTRYMINFALYKQKPYSVNRAERTGSWSLSVFAITDQCAKLLQCRIFLSKTDQFGKQWIYDTKWNIYIGKTNQPSSSFWCAPPLWVCCTSRNQQSPEQPILNHTIVTVEFVGPEVVFDCLHPYNSRTCMWSLQSSGRDVVKPTWRCHWLPLVHKQRKMLCLICQS